ncbi:MAG TPA: DUF4111 domain-containing protein [Anaerolineaceae bacterium]|nr:DUF4111 domain-containing protein [Anaerolineaceae bacterium]HPN53990.1 DUF4111 domain-containing protein [Anaerolineaceae bacterium]
MAWFGYEDVPEAVQAQISTLIQTWRETLGSKLIGIYLHGSLAMGCFNPARSDLDFLLLVDKPLEDLEATTLAEAALRLSLRPAPVEMSVLRQADLIPWRHPAPYEFHYSESWRERFSTAKSLALPQPRPCDPDLAAHITITRARGRDLWGPPPQAVFPEVPADDYLASIGEDFDDAWERAAENPVYALLNTCRVMAFVQDGLITSKREGGEWGLAHLPAGLRPLAARALEAYENETAPAEFQPAQLDGFAVYARGQLRL